MSAEEMYFSSIVKRREKFRKERRDMGMSSPNFNKRSVFTRLGKHPYDKGHKSIIGMKSRSEEVDSHNFRPVTAIPASPPNSPSKSSKRFKPRRPTPPSSPNKPPPTVQLQPQSSICYHYIWSVGQVNQVSQGDSSPQVENN